MFKPESKASPSLCGCREAFGEHGRAVGAFHRHARTTAHAAACWCARAATSFSPLSVCLLPLLPLRQGQLESIPSSFLAQTRSSQGPLIKDKPSSFLCVSFISSSSLLCHLSSSPLHPSLFELPFSLHCNLFPSFQWRLPRHSSLPPGHLAPSSPRRHGGGLISTLGRSSESICTKSRTCYSPLPVLTMCPVTRAV